MAAIVHGDAVVQQAHQKMTEMQLKRSNFIYTQFYCEENVYLLCKRLAECGYANQDASDLAVIFISNPYRSVPLWRQRAASLCDYVVWDYHVICIQVGKPDAKGAQVWDLDSDLPFPISLQTYAEEALWNGLSYPPMFHEEYQRLYRVIRGDHFLRFFASDRSHMVNLETGNWQEPPPTYAPIVAEDGEINHLQNFVRTELHSAEISVDDVHFSTLGKDGKDGKYGIVLDEREFLKLFGEGG